MMLQSASTSKSGRPFGLWFLSLLVVPVTVLVAFAGAVQAQVGACQTNCATLGVGSATAPAGGSATVTVSFAQAPTSDGAPGGPDGTAAVAFTLQAPGDGSTPLRLDGCTAGDDPTLPDAVRPSASLDGFRLVLENYRCDDGRTHCLCPESGSGITPDDFLNIAIYGPDPLPEPGAGPVTIPVLPSGDLFTVRFKVPASAAAGTDIALHVLNQADDSSKGQFRAFLSLGDTEAVDQTCVPQAGTPPCTAVNARSQVTVADGAIMVQEGSSCVGDCDGSNDVTVDEIITMVNIGLGSQSVSACLAGDSNGDGQVTVDEIVTAVNNALNGCPS